MRPAACLTRVCRLHFVAHADVVVDQLGEERDFVAKILAISGVAISDVGQDAFASPVKTSSPGTDQTDELNQVEKL